MYWKVPSFIPNDPTGNEYNPQGSMPFPRRPHPPVGLWSGSEGILPLTANADPDIWRTSVWLSPTFDLRPDLRSSTGNSAIGVPIWNSGSLWVQINGLLGSSGFATEGLTVTYREQCSVNQPKVFENAANLLDIADPVDISDQFTTNGTKQAAILQFNSIGAFSPVRFWRIRMDFTWSEDISAQGDPTFTVISAYY
jgi:hypothetical protein